MTRTRSPACDGSCERPRHWASLHQEGAGLVLAMVGRAVRLEKSPLSVLALSETCPAMSWLSWCFGVKWQYDLNPFVEAVVS